MVEHALIPDDQRHELKGASTATAGQVPVSQGDGTTRFQFYDFNDLAGKPAYAGYRQIMYGASSASSQAPSATNTPLQVEFGSNQTTADVTLGSDGTLTFNVAGDYLVVLFMRMGRTAGAGSANLFSRLLYNDSPILSSNATKLPDADSVAPFSTSMPFRAAANDTLKVQIMRDSSGINNGGLYQVSASASGWSPCPSASVIVFKYVGAT